MRLPFTRPPSINFAFSCVCAIEGPREDSRNPTNCAVRENKHKYIILLLLANVYVMVLSKSIVCQLLQQCHSYILIHLQILLPFTNLEHFFISILHGLASLTYIHTFIHLPAAIPFPIKLHTLLLPTACHTLWPLPFLLLLACNRHSCPDGGSATQHKILQSLAICRTRPHQRWLAIGLTSSL